MKNIINLCKVAIMNLNESSLPPFKTHKTVNGDIFITSAGGSRIARIWLNTFNDDANAEIITHSLNNSFRYAAALAIACEKLQSLGITEMPELDKCFENDKLNFKQLDKFEH